jgi:hypothetical protein
MTPIASPSHQVHQSAPLSTHEANPPTVRLATPIVALSMGLSRPANTVKRKMSGARSKAWQPLARRRTRRAPRRTVRVLPQAIPRAGATEPKVKTRTTMVPRNTPGQTRVPSSRQAARATPMAGRTAVTWGWRKARRRPSRPTMA